MNPTYENIPSTFKQNKMSFLSNQPKASSRDLSARSKLEPSSQKGRNESLLSQRQYQTLDERDNLNKTTIEKNEKMLEEIHKMRQKIAKDHEKSKEGQSLLNKKQRKDFMAEYFEAKKNLQQK